jgi:hypothetical protein
VRVNAALSVVFLLSGSAALVYGLLDIVAPSFTIRWQVRSTATNGGTRQAVGMGIQRVLGIDPNLTLGMIRASGAKSDGSDWRWRCLPWRWSVWALGCWSPASSGYIEQPSGTTASCCWTSSRSVVATNQIRDDRSEAARRQYATRRDLAQHDIGGIHVSGLT